MKSTKLITICLIIIFSLSSNAQKLFAEETSNELIKKGIQDASDNDLYLAMEDFDRAISLSDKKAAINYHNIGYTFELQNNTVDATANYEEAIKRNPRQIPSIERAGYLNYKMKNYGKAVMIGEAGMKIDPENKEIPTWLNDAKKEYNKIIANEKDKENKESDYDEMVRKRKKVSIAWDITARTAYFWGGTYKYVSTPGLLGNVPQMLYVSYMPDNDVELRLTAGNPYLGSLSENSVSMTERLEGVFYNEGYFLGGGVMGNHYYGDTFLDKKTHMLSDAKIGLLFGFYETKSRLDVTFYPDLIPYDAGYKKNKTLDSDYIDIMYRYRTSPDTRLLIGMTVNEYYFYDHKVPYSDYSGVYDFYAGYRFFDRPGSKLIAEARFTEKYYTGDRKNKKPYSSLNGQGFFGFNKNRWLWGSPISGFRGLGHSLSGSLTHKMNDHLYIYESLSAEIVSFKNKENDICVKIGLKVEY